MRKLTLFLLFAGSYLTLTAQSPRRVLLEVFTNASCTPCKPYQDDLHEFLDTLNLPYTMVQYHVDWPSIDPMNAHNTVDPHTRRIYYGVTGVPRSYIDCSVNGLPDYADLATAQAVPASFDIDLSHWLSANADSIYFKAVFTATQTVNASSLKGFVSIQEELVEFDEPPGYNGEVDFWNVHKAMLPDIYGLAMPGTMNPGDSVVYEGGWELKNVYKYPELAVAAFVQDYTNKVTYQSAYSPPQPMPFEISIAAVGGRDLNVTGSSSSTIFSADFSTTLSTADDYTFEIDKTGLPAGWFANVTAGSVSDLISVDANIPGNGSLTVNVSITSGTTADETGELKLIAHNKNQLTGYVTEATFTVHANPTNLVIHASDPNKAWWMPWPLEEMFAPVVTILQDDFDRIEITEFTDANIDQIFLGTFTEQAADMLTDDQIGKLTSYLDSGGDLLIQGEDIGLAQSSAAASQVFKNFYQDYLGAQYVSNYEPIDTFIYSIASDSVFGPINYVDTLNSDWYWVRADRVFPYGNYATPCFQYGNATDSWAGIRNEDPTKGWKVVYLAWAIDYTWNHEAKQDLFAKAIEWFDQLPAVGNPEWATQTGARLGQSYPNPAAEQVTVPFSGLKRAGKLELLDLQGRVLRSWEIRPGQRSLVLDLGEFDAGLYFYRLSEGKVLVGTEKMVVR